MANTDENKGDLKQKKIEPGRTRTCNLLIRSQTRYPLRYRSLEYL